LIFLQGKIRVYCRVRPLSSSERERGCRSVTTAPDEYSLVIADGTKHEEFQFDSIFLPEHSQERVYEDTGNLIQSAVDGFNVCIFAYGQTGWHRHRRRRHVFELSGSRRTTPALRPLGLLPLLQAPGKPLP
jgi:hypothetical protein